MIGRILSLEESRDIAVVRDTLGNAVELLPIDSTIKSQLKLSLDLPSGRSVEFLVSVPAEVLPLLSETVRIPRSVEELAEQLHNDLNGIDDDHDKTVKAAEGGLDYEKVRERARAEQDSGLEK